MIRRALLRLVKGSCATFVGVFISALTFASQSFAPEGEMATLVWKAAGISLFSGIILALEKLKKMLNESHKGS